MWAAGGFQVYKGESNQLVMEEKGGGGGDSTVRHMENFLAACRSRDHKSLTAEIEIGAQSAALCHLANISYRVGRKLAWDGARKSFVNDAEATKLLTRDYRRPYVV
jgi:hypothetical protein